MIKFTTKIFKEGKNIDDSSMSAEICMSKEDKEALFNDSLRSVIIGKLCEKFRGQMTDMCYSDEALEQYGPAKKMEEDGYNMKKILKRYPKAPVYSSMSRYCIDKEFDLQKFLNKIVSAEHDRFVEDL